MQRDKRMQLSWACEEQLFRQEIENADDIRLSVRLLVKCMPDKRKVGARSQSRLVKLLSTMIEGPVSEQAGEDDCVRRHEETAGMDMPVQTLMFYYRYHKGNHDPWFCCAVLQGCRARQCPHQAVP
jgi:hypothetical protein